MQPQYGSVQYEREGEIARIILGASDHVDPARWVGKGAESLDLWSALDRAAGDDEIKVVIIGGPSRAQLARRDGKKRGESEEAGDEAPGIDERPTQQTRLRADRDGLMEHGFKKLLYHPKLTITKVRGYAVAGGLTLLAASDFSIVSEDCVVGDVGERFGFAGCGHAHMGLLVARVGLTRAIDLMVTGRWISGKHAEEIGLVTMAVPADRVDYEATRLARGLCLHPRDGIAIGKATRHVLYEQMGLSHSMVLGYLSHTLFTNVRFQPGEWNFFHERREKGAMAAFKEKDDIFGQYIDDYRPRAAAQERQ